MGEVRWNQNEGKITSKGKSVEGLTRIKHMDPEVHLQEDPDNPVEVEETVGEPTGQVQDLLPLQNFR
jgi:hypothetical protein